METHQRTGYALSSLNRKHAELEEQLREASSRPMRNDDEVNKIKREKLRVQDEKLRILSAV